MTAPGSQNNGMGEAGILLSTERQRLQVLPEIGGSLGFWRFDWDQVSVDLLRPGSAEAVAAGRVGDLACFPLVPFSNRIREGRFRFGGRDIALPLNFGDHPHAIHGQGWQTPWRVDEQTTERCAISFDHPAGDWPWSYSARQEIALMADGLAMTLALTNRSEESMPAGVGFHPYFAGARSARLTAGVSGVWETDAEVMPVRHGALPERWNLPEGQYVKGLLCDNVFTDWDRSARIERPDLGLAIALRAEPPLNFLVVYAPEGADFFCVEPASHATDAFNLAAQGDSGSGMCVLAPDETLTASVSVTVEPI